MNKIMILLLLLLAFGSCHKERFKLDKKRLPKATTKGRGIFACYIDDQTYIGRRRDKVTYNQNTGYLFLENRSEWFEFRFFIYEGLFSEGIYALDSTGEEWIDDDYTRRYGLKDGGVNVIEITKLDLDEEIVSGKFNIDLVDSAGNEKIITDGRFDLEMEVIK